jgi:hypothetical protein
MNFKTVVGTADGAAGNNNANLRGIRAPHF